MATPALELIAGSTYPSVAAVLSDINGPINLTTATSVTFLMKGALGGIVTGAATITNAATGAVQYAWGSSDTLVADVYSVEWVIIWPGAKEQVVPNAASARQIIQIDAALDPGVD